jgi:hypothetical protein
MHFPTEKSELLTFALQLITVTFFIDKPWFNKEDSHKNFTDLGLATLHFLDSEGKWG